VRAVRVYNKVLSSQVVHPACPMNQDTGAVSSRSSGENNNGDEQQRGTKVGEDTDSLIPRVCDLEARASVLDEKVFTLGRDGDTIGGWKKRVDAASEQTARVLQTLDRELCELKGRVGGPEILERSHGENSSGDRMETMWEQLDLVSWRLEKAEKELVDKDTFVTMVGELKTEMAEVGLVADTALANVSQMEQGLGAATESVSALNEDVSGLSSQVEMLKLALEVVEQSIEDFDESDIVESLRSRMDDLDAGIENNAELSMSKIREISAILESLKEKVEHTESTASLAVSKADTAVAEASRVGHEVDEMRQEMRASTLKFESFPTSGTASPAASMSRSSDARVKAAIHTLSDGYRSLHKAMSLMYKEQDDVAKKVTRVGIEAGKLSRMDRNLQPVKTMYLLEQRNRKCQHLVSSHPIVLEESDDDEGEYIYSSMDAHHSLVISQMMDVQRAERRADALEIEVRELRSLLTSLCASPSDVSQQQQQQQSESKTAPVNVESSPQRMKVNIAWSQEQDKVVLNLASQNDWKIAAKN